MNIVFKSIFVFSFRVDDGFVVDESRRTNQHETVFFYASSRRVSFHLECCWLFTAPYFIHRPFI